MNQRLKPDLSLAAVSFIWGATFVVVQRALGSASVFVFLALRFSVAAAVLALLYPKSFLREHWRTFRPGVLLGCILFAGYSFQTVGLRFTTPSKAAFITGTSVVMVPLTQAALGKTRISRWVWSGAAAALAGLYLLAIPAAGWAGLNRGDVLAFGCAVMFAAHIILVGRYSPRCAAGALSLYQVGVAAVLTGAAVPVASAAGWEATRLEWTGRLVFAVVLTAVFATALAFSVQIWAQKFTSASHAAILFSLEPVFAALTSYVVAGERLGGRAFAGAALIFGGILLAELRGGTQAPADAV